MHGHCTCSSRAFRFSTEVAVYVPPRAVCTPRRFSSAAVALALRPARSPCSSGCNRAAGLPWPPQHTAHRPLHRMVPQPFSWAVAMSRQLHPDSRHRAVWLRYPLCAKPGSRCYQSITSSARVSTAEGTMRSRVLAILRFKANSNAVGRSIGISPGATPRNI